MSAAITVDVTSGVPPYEQIRTQIASLIATGALPAGTRLPTVRDLATDLGVAVGTVARAYRELEAAGLVTSRRRTGTVVAAGGTVGDAPVQAAVSALVAAARRSGLADDDVLALVRGALLGGREPS
ncbi:MAG: GntR family transcriptional regulator [Actinobacteria bacterium]|nr:GntR family transcriptional regulator [Actinomycetota bacterium]